MANHVWIGDAVRVVVEPDHGTVDSEVSVQIVVAVERDDVPEGTTIIISLLGPHAWPPLLGPDDRGEIGGKCPVSVEYPAHAPGRFEVDNRALRRAIILRPAGAGLRRGDRIRIHLGDARGAAHLPPFDCRIPLAVFVVPAGGTPAEMPDPPSFLVVPDTAAQVRLFIASQALVGAPTWTHIRMVDRFGNTASDFTGTLALATSDPQAQLVGSVPFGAEHRGLRRIPGAVTWKTAGIQRVNAKVAGSGLQAVSNPAEVVASANGIPRLVWGDFHGHTYLSDGLEGPDFYYRYARDVEALDFSGISDHSHGHREAWEDDPVLQDDSAGLAFREGGPPSKYPHWPSRLTRWAEMKRAAAEYHDPGHFVAFLGYEWNAGQIREPNFGAKCVYFPGGSGSMLTYFDSDAADPNGLWETLRPTGAITIPHHTAYPLNDLPPGVDWRYHDPVMQPVVEIYSKHGNSECYGNPRSPSKVQKGNFVQDALARGHRIGIIAGSDSHLSRPGSDCVEYEKGYYRQGGLAAVYTEGLTRRAILDALRTRCCYGTTNGRILLRFDVDGHQMGEVRKASRAEIASREIHVFVAGTASLRTVEIISNNDVVRSWSPTTMEGTFAWLDDRPLVGSTYYYARIAQTDGEMAWSSPVWIDLPADR